LQSFTDIFNLVRIDGNFLTTLHAFNEEEISSNSVFQNVNHCRNNLLDEVLLYMIEIFSFFLHYIIEFL